MTENSEEFRTGLARHLRRAELEYRSRVIPDGSCVDWLAEHCETAHDIEDYLRELGFRISSVHTGDAYPWFYPEMVITTSGIAVYANTKNVKGLVGRWQSY